MRITSSTSERVREFALVRPGPATIEFTANLGADGQANSPMTQGFFGTAQPGSAIRVGSEWGVAETTAGPGGQWETTLVMHEVPPGTNVAVRITSSTTDRVREFTLHRPGAPTPTTVDFTANAAFTTTDAATPFNEYWGTSTSGAVISITSEYGSKQVESNAEGKWSARLEFPDCPGRFDVQRSHHQLEGRGRLRLPAHPGLPQLRTAPSRIVRDVSISSFNGSGRHGRVLASRFGGAWRPDRRRSEGSYRH